MNQVDASIHSLNGALANIKFDDIPNSNGFKYYYAEGRLYLVKEPSGFIKIVTANSPFGAWRNAMKGANQ